MEGVHVGRWFRKSKPPSQVLSAWKTKGQTMKSPTTNQPSLMETGLRRHLTHANAAVAGAVAILLLGTMATAGGKPPACSVQIRPIEDFLDAQGTPDGPAELRSIGWTDPKTERFALVDFTGFANQWIEEESGGAISLGTETKGKIIERRLPDGRAEVTVAAPHQERPDLGDGAVGVRPVRRPPRIWSPGPRRIGRSGPGFGRVVPDVGVH